MPKLETRDVERSAYVRGRKAVIDHLVELGVLVIDGDGDITAFIESEQYDEPVKVVVFGLDD